MAKHSYIIKSIEYHLRRSIQCGRWMKIKKKWIRRMTKWTRRHSGHIWRDEGETKKTKHSLTRTHPNQNQWASRQRSYNRIVKKNAHFLSIYTCSEFVNEQVQPWTVWIYVSDIYIARNNGTTYALHSVQCVVCARQNVKEKREFAFFFRASEERTEQSSQRKKNLLKNLRTHSKWIALQQQVVVGLHRRREQLANGTVKQCRMHKNKLNEATFAWAKVTKKKV